MCGTSGGGFALMTEAIGMAGMIEAPVVIVNVQRGGPSTGVPTKTEQADLNQVFGASQGDYPRSIIAPTDTTDCFYSAVEALNLAEKYQLPVTIISDLLVSEHPETIEADALTNDVPIDRGEIVSDWPESKGTYKRYAFTKTGISPRALPGTEGTLYVAATDDHDEEGVLISDIFTTSAIRRKVQEKRMRKLDGLLRDTPPPMLEGPVDAEVTLIGWGSTKGVIHEAIVQLAAGYSSKPATNKIRDPFSFERVTKILRGCKTTICIEANYTGQFARHLRAETGITVDHHLLKYDCEPFEPRQIVEEVKAILEGRERSRDVTAEEAREMAYHYIRSRLTETLRPGKIIQRDGNGFDEAVWDVEIVTRESGDKRGELLIGIETGSTYSWFCMTQVRSPPSGESRVTIDNRLQLPPEGGLRTRNRRTYGNRYRATDSIVRRTS
jgi:2-oxoglutarate ferredoxin oxidoreductase subunit alpha